MGRWQQLARPLALLAPRLKPLYWEQHQLLPKNSVWQLDRKRFLPKLEFNAAKATSFFQVCIQASREKTRNVWCTCVSDAARDRRSSMAMAYRGIQQSTPAEPADKATGLHHSVYK